MSSHVAVTTAPRVCFFPQLPTTICLRFLLYLLYKVPIV